MKGEHQLLVPVKHTDRPNPQIGKKCRKTGHNRPRDGRPSRNKGGPYTPLGETFSYATFPQGPKKRPGETRDQLEKHRPPTFRIREESPKKINMGSYPKKEGTALNKNENKLKKTGTFYEVLP